MVRLRRWDQRRLDEHRERKIERSGGEERDMERRNEIERKRVT